MRLLFDPVLGDAHAGGVFQVFPPRSIAASALRPDFVVVSHAHFDHFDVDSLAALAAYDPDIVLVTSDDMVAEAGSALGFHTVKLVKPGTRIELDAGLSLSTTPSHAPDIEWGVLLTDESGAVWNMIDTAFRTAADVEHVAKAALRGRPLDLALAPIQPLREIAIATAGQLGFDLNDYAHLLSCGAASGARFVAPSACGEAFREPFAVMNGWVYPVSRARAVRDLAAFAPQIRCLNPALGEALVVEGSHVTVEPGDIEITAVVQPDPRVFRPLEPLALVDPNLDHRPLTPMRDCITAWAHGALAQSIARELGGKPALDHVSLVLEVVFQDGCLPFSFDTRGKTREVSDPEYDVLVMVAASMLDDVIAGRRAWVEPLLAGLLRSSTRGAHVQPGRCDWLDVTPMFVYYAIPYRASTAAAVSGRVAAKLRARV